jgi:DNA-binding protein HU-beta
MNRVELIESIQNELGSSKSDAERALNAVLDGIRQGLKTKKLGNNVQLVGFGNFKVVSRKARTGKNPKTGETINIPASKTVRFSPGKPLKDMVS